MRNLPKHNLVCGDKSDGLFEEPFLFVFPGYNVRPLGLEGVLGVERVNCFPYMVEERRKNEVTKYIDSEVNGTLKNAERIDHNEWFIGNHCYLIPGAFSALATL